MTMQHHLKTNLPLAAMTMEHRISPFLPTIPSLPFVVLTKNEAPSRHATRSGKANA